MVSHTYISRLRLVNFRLYKKAELELHPRLCLFLGDNGAGKSSILDAISLAVSRIFPLCHYAPALTGLPYHLGNVTCSIEEFRGRRRLKYAEISGVDCTLREGENEWHLIASYNAKAVPGFPASQQKDVALLYNRSAEEDSGIPVFAYYGPHRGAKQGDRKRFGRRRVNFTNPFAAYINALQPGLDFDAFLDWFSEQEYAELRRRQSDACFVSSELQAVREAIERVFSCSGFKCRDPRFESNPKRFVMTCETSGRAPMELGFDQLSDGYRGMIALVADFARRLVVANPCGSENPLDGRGILLIDEVDAHLHPKWQYRVLDDLSRTFPNVQMIVTTHSAEVASMVDKSSIYLLESQDGILSEIHPEQQTQGNYPEEIAATVMHAPCKVGSVPAYQDYMDCLAAIQHDRGDEEDAFRQAFARVVHHYGEDHDLVRELRARLEGLKKRKALIAGLREKRS